jgi:hypothetical protein
MMNLEKTTPGGHFTVTIHSNVDMGQALTVRESAESLKDLSDMLTRAAELALEAAIKLLTESARVAPGEAN